MQTYRYKDKRVKYYYALAFSMLYLLDLFHLLDNSDAAHAAASAITTIAGLALLLYALSGLRERVVFKDDKVLFIKLLATDIHLDSIQSIQLCDKGQLCFKVTYNKLNSETWALSFYESDEDITVFRNALAELIRRAREANPAVEVDDHCLLMSDGSSDYAEAQTSTANKKKEELTGLGGWLAFIVFNLVCALIGAFITGLQDCLRYTTTQVSVSVTGVAWAGNLTLVLLNVGTLVFIIITLAMLFNKLKLFKTWYVYSMIYNVVTTFFSVSFAVFLGSSGLTLSAVLFSILLPTAFPVLWVFVWKAYFQRSIRVENTFIN